MASIHEQYGRQLKATKLADLLDALHITAAVASGLTKPNWESFARLAQVRTASGETQLLVVELLKAREAAREWVALSMVEGLVVQKSAA